MIQTETKNILVTAIAEALEKMAFLAVLPDDEAVQEPSIILSAKIDFSGPLNGELQVVVDIELARTIGENISGMEELNDEECIDALKEFVNVASGLILPMVATSQADVFDLTVPHPCGIQGQEQWNQFTAGDDVAVLNAEGFPIAARLTISENH